MYNRNYGGSCLIEFDFLHIYLCISKKNVTLKTITDSYTIPLTNTKNEKDEKINNPFDINSSFRLRANEQNIY